MNDNSNTPESFDEKKFVEDLTEKIKVACKGNNYMQLCNRIKTEAGLAYVVNRSIKMMADDQIKLSSVLPLLESELEGMN